MDGIRTVRMEQSPHSHLPSKLYTNKTDSLHHLSGQNHYLPRLNGWAADLKDHRTSSAVSTDVKEINRMLRMAAGLCIYLKSLFRQTKINSSFFFANWIYFSSWFNTFDHPELPLCWFKVQTVQAMKLQGGNSAEQLIISTKGRTVFSHGHWPHSTDYQIHHALILTSAFPEGWLQSWSFHVPDCKWDKGHRDRHVGKTVGTPLENQF